MFLFCAILLPKSDLKENSMGFKIIEQNFTFADAILKDSMDKNRCLKRLSDISGSIDWDRINSVLMSHYRVGTSR